MNETKQSVYPWRRAIWWLVFLGPFFFISYGFATWWTSQLEHVDSIVFYWEHRIPFIAWTIIPYWIIDILYVVSIFICLSQKELDRHALRLFTAQVIAVCCFLLFPLSFSFVRPETSGFYGLLVDLLTSFDKPFNQAPSLHIALLVILWVLYPKHLPRLLQWPFHLLALMIGISVLTTYQHHFVDIPTGMLLGWFCIWLWPQPDRDSPLRKLKTPSPRSLAVAAFYITGALAMAALAFSFGGSLLWFYWPAVSLLLVACFYAGLGVVALQKDDTGHISLACRWLLFPYIQAAKLSAWLFTLGKPEQNHIVDEVYLGRFPNRQALSRDKIKGVVDLTAEFQRLTTKVNWYCHPCLDLLPLQERDLENISTLIENAAKQGPVLVCCALGYSRSAMAVIYWLVVSKRATNLQAAMEIVTQARPNIVLNDGHQWKLRQIFESGS